MKTVSLFAVLVVAVCLIGCENAELVTCQQEKDTLQSQVDQANAAVTAKETQIETLKTENTEMQTKAMEGISTIIKKQAEKEEQLSQKFIEKAQEVQDLKVKIAALEAQIDTHVCPVSEAVVVEEVEVVE
jgi:outer membrane murein-binding lipoprotein Lpp